MIPRLLFDQNVLNQCLQQPTFWYRLGDSLIDKGILTSMSGGADFIPTLTYSGVVEFLGLPKKIEKAMKDTVPPIKTWREVESVATHLERCRDAYARLPLLQPASLQTELQQKREHCVARAENGWHDVQPLFDRYAAFVSESWVAENLPIALAYNRLMREFPIERSDQPGKLEAPGLLDIYGGIRQYNVSMFRLAAKMYVRAYDAADEETRMTHPGFDPDVRQAMDLKLKSDLLDCDIVHIASAGYFDTHSKNALPHPVVVVTQDAAEIVRPEPLDTWLSCEHGCQT